MAKYLTYDVILGGHEVLTAQDAIDYARGMVFDAEPTTQNISHARYIDSVNGVGIYYDYGADYYFFTDETEG